MSSRIKQAFRGKEIVWLADVQRGEKGLRCCVCTGRLSVRDGKGELAKGKGRRSVPKSKHFAYVVEAVFKYNIRKVADPFNAFIRSTVAGTA